MNPRKIAEIVFIVILSVTVILLISKLINILISLIIIMLLIILLIFIRSDYGCELTFKVLGQHIFFKLKGSPQTKNQGEDMEIQENVVEELK